MSAARKNTNFMNMELAFIGTGWPSWLENLADFIYRRLPEDDALQFEHEILAATQACQDMDLVRKQFLIAVQRRNLERIANNDEPYAKVCQQAIAGVIAFLESNYATGFAVHAGRWSVTEAAREAAQSAYMSKWSCSKWSAAESALAAACSAEWPALESYHPVAKKAWALARVARVKATVAAYDMMEQKPDQRPSVGAETARSAAQAEELRAQRDILLALIREAGK